MGCIGIYPQDVIGIINLLCQSGREIRHYDLSRSPYFVNRYVRLACSNKKVSIDDLYYHFCLAWSHERQSYDESHVFLIASKNNYKIRPLIKYLKEKTDTKVNLVWETAYCCRLDTSINDNSELPLRFKDIIDLFDPIIDAFFVEQERIEKSLALGEGTPFISASVNALQCDIVKVKDLPFKSFRIPPYQRTYKWKPTNVNQFINDIREYATKQSEYRLGSLILHNSDIVDGQQRIVTLSLILYRMMRNPVIRSHKEYEGLFNQVIGFLGRTKYSSADALMNISNNTETIQKRQDDLDFQFFKHLVEDCEFVVIRLPKLHEAFQFFDSQNARGKELEAHDLLKAYHLREIDNLDKTDLEDIRLWQRIPTPRLVSLFLCLYRIRMWSKGESAYFFTKADVGEFKGITIGKDMSPMPMFKQAVMLNQLFNMISTGGDKPLQRQDYPFQLSEVIINGSRFFDMILHYDELFSHIIDPSWNEYDTDARDILTLLNGYDGMSRTGDEYVRNVFDALLLFYVDKFDAFELGKASKLFFQYAYSIRLSQYRVSLATIEKAVLEKPLFKIIRNSTTPYDVLNYQVDTLRFSDLAKNKSDDLYQWFEDMNMIKHQ